MKTFSKYVARQFGNPSGIGGLLATFTMNRLNGKQYRAVLENIKTQLSDTILDVGFGNGYLIGKLLKQNLQRICGIDISQDMLAKVSRKNKSLVESGKLDLRLADVKELPFEDACFDRVCTVNTLYFWKDSPTCFSEIMRTLKPQGRFLNVFYTKEWLEKMPYTKYGFSKYSVEQITEMTERSGLRIIQMIEIEPGVSFCVIAEKPCEIFQIRKADISDIPDLKELFRNTILSVNRKDYSLEEVEDWASCGDYLPRWHELFAEQHYMVTENGKGKIVGFASINDIGYMHTLFVHKDYQHQGIATILNQTIEQYAKEKGTKEITSEVSITAKPFFEKMGFTVDEEQKRKANKLYLTNYKMSKLL